MLGGTILEPGNYVCLTVADNGCGIEPNQLAHIFDPFFSTKDTGTRLGLSATLGIIRAHQGGIRVQSEVGKGTEFTVYFSSLPPRTHRNSGQNNLDWYRSGY